MKVYLLRFELESDITDIKQYVLDSIEKRIYKDLRWKFSGARNWQRNSQANLDIWNFIKYVNGSRQNRIFGQCCWQCMALQRLLHEKVEPIIETRPVVRERCKSCGRFLATKKYISTCKGVKFKNAYVEIKCNVDTCKKLKSDII